MEDVTFKVDPGSHLDQRKPSLFQSEHAPLSHVERFLSAPQRIGGAEGGLPMRSTNFGNLPIKPATLFKFHKALVDRKYRLLFSSSSHRRKPGPKGPSAELIAAIVELKRRNPRFGCVRIAQQIAHAFGIEIDKDVVRRVLAKHYRPGTPEPMAPLG